MNPSTCRLGVFPLAGRTLCQVIGLCVAFILGAERASAQSEAASPFEIVPSIISSNGLHLSVAFRIPEHHRLYADKLSFELNGKPAPFALPQAKHASDKANDGEKRVFSSGFSATLPIAASRTEALSLTIALQGCNASECFFPETRSWIIKPDNSVASAEATGTAASEKLLAGGETRGFRVAGRASGFLSGEKFVRFLDQTSDAKSPAPDSLGRFASLGIVATVGLILLGGLALNLTPCVLPMIPINLAILGVGVQNQNRRRGFALGTAYGAGMALAYGVLGLAVVLTGSKFGALNASPWFNFGIAAVFVVLGLAMFDKIMIDLSRLQRTGTCSTGSGGAFLAAGSMGSISALLAGACVAPVVISVLLLAATFYQKGQILGLALPFVLGIGMALPWPLAAAGLSFLPKPGAWMTRVKYVFGVIIFGFAIWYGAIGWNLATGWTTKVAARTTARSDRGLQELRAALEAARGSGRPVLVDFWASWCKNCAAMEHSTLRDSTVRERLKDYHFVKFQAEHLSDASVKPLLDEFGVMGLPTYVVLVPEPLDASIQSTPQATKN